MPNNMEFEQADPTTYKAIWAMFRENGEPVDDLEAFITLFHTLFQKNPYSIHYQLIGKQDDRIVAHEAMVPFSYRIAQQNYIGGLLCNLLIEQHYRSLTAFFSLESHILKHYPLAHIDFSFTLVNRKSVLKLHFAAGYKKIGDLPIYVKPYRIENIMKQHLKNTLLRPLLAPFAFIGNKLLQLYPFYTSSARFEIIPAKEFPEDINTMISARLHDFPITAHRSAAILNWRFTQLAHRHYQIFFIREKQKEDILGYIVLRRMNMKDIDVLAVVDFLFPLERKDVGKTLLGFIHRFAIKQRVDAVAVLLNPHSPYKKFLQRFGCVRSPESFTLIFHHPQNNHIHIGEEDFRNWHITWFEHDYV